jgi:hypothetical protein
MKLRKLLHEYDAAVASLGGAALGGAPSGSPSRHGGSGAGMGDMYDFGATGGSGGNGGGGANNGNPPHTSSTTSRQITEASRLRLEELSAWFAQDGANEMPEVTLDVVTKVFKSVTRTNTDGRMCIRDLRQWYISYGKRALQKGLLKLDGGADSGLVPVQLVKPSTVAVKEAAGRKVLPPVNKGLYSWEDGGGEGAGGAASSSSSAAAAASAAASAVPAGPMGLPNAMVEFQVRLTPEEFRAMSLRRRQYESELKFKGRIEKAHGAGPHAFTKTRTKEEDEQRAATLRDTPFQDPGATGSYVFRSS